MSENQTYTDQTYTDATDDSYLEVRRTAGGHLRLVAYESGCYGATVDLSRTDVERLVEQAQAWLEETKPKPPTTPGSVVRVRRDSSDDLILTRLNDTGVRHLADRDDMAQWVTQYGTFWSDANIVNGYGLGPWEVVYDAGAEG
jgi:hypothetical protein